MLERLDRASDRLQKKIKSQSSGVFRDKINLQIDRNFGGNFGQKKTIGNLKSLQAAACSKHEIHHEPTTERKYGTFDSRFSKK